MRKVYNDSIIHPTKSLENSIVQFAIENKLMCSPNIYGTAYEREIKQSQNIWLFIEYIELD
jgi:hypothetical protein